jgi:hypothetical protein
MFWSNVEEVVRVVGGFEHLEPAQVGSICPGHLIASLVVVQIVDVPAGGHGGFIASWVSRAEAMQRSVSALSLLRKSRGLDVLVDTVATRGISSPCPYPRPDPLEARQ